ncbi:MAG TPA: glycine-rich protein [Bacilli bacterium]|nr:glycine-rich protein [Bacilli bacterium]
MKKGFTLVELIAMIIILGVVLLLSYTSLTKALKDTKTNYEDSNKNKIASACEAFVETNLDRFPSLKENGGSTNVYASTLVEEGFLNGKLEQEMSCNFSHLFIKVTKNSNKILEYEYNCGEHSEYVPGSCEVANNTSWTYSYTGSEVNMSVPCDGIYKLETWGAQGGAANETYIGGYGAYVAGTIDMYVNQKFYVNVGGAGVTTTTSGEVAGGYNGGGNSLPTSVSGGRGSGGGATSIATTSGLLSTLESYKGAILIVAAGGGGGGYYSASEYGTGGSGGGILGVDGISNNINTIGHGGTQTTGGIGATTSQVDGSFGQGAKGGTFYGGAGGGGGFYGGGSATNNGGAGGGSSYIGNSLLTNKAMYCFGCQRSNGANTKTLATTDFDEEPTVNFAKVGNGYARITLISSK